MNISALREKLVPWFLENRRSLPWRANRDPYRIWISEIMLQQTRVTAVIPYYEKFMCVFPTVQALAGAEEATVLQMWAGLGYYSRARNLHQAAKQFASQGFPQTADQLAKFPGLGPYTSRAVASLAFGSRVGVLDGNVIRILSRVSGQEIRWWESSGKAILQNWSDELAQYKDSSSVNQGLMELGATICTPKNPTCLLCPWFSNCSARKLKNVLQLPLSKPKRKSEIWVWDVEIYINKNQVYLEPHSSAPFLKRYPQFPGTISMQPRVPKIFALKHSITHHNIYLRPKVLSHNRLKASSLGQWIPISDLKKINPSSLLTKVLAII